MFLRNYYNYLAWMYFRKTPTSGTFGEGELCVKRYNGTVQGSAALSTYYISPFPDYTGGSLNGSSPRFVFGGGDTPVTFDDYTLASPFSSSIIPDAYGSSNIREKSFTYDETTHTYSREVVLTIKNISVDPITIKEVGILTNDVLTYRDVLVTPITVSSNETIDFTYTFTYTFPEVSS